MFIRYKNIVYRYIQRRNELVTAVKEKADDTFSQDGNIFYKQIDTMDQDIQDMYEIDFYVGYIDTSETVKDAEKYVYEGSGMAETSQRAVRDGIWCVNEGIPLYRRPILEENELGLSLNQVSCSEDWIQDDRSYCSKIIDLYDCSEYIVCYTYSFKDGVQLPEVEIVEVRMEAEAFKEEMLKHRSQNV